MTDTTGHERTATPLSQSIELALTNQPDVKNKYGSGRIRPQHVVFYYLDGRINAHLYGVWVREDGEVTDAPVDQDYRHDADWPDWLASLARDHQPAVAPATDAVAVEAERDSLGREADRLRKDWVEMRTRAERAERIQENADFHLGQEMARRQSAEKETDRLRAVIARIGQMADHWEQQLPEVIRTPAVVSALRAALEPAAVPAGQAPATDRADVEAQQPKETRP